MTQQLTPTTALNARSEALVNVAQRFLADVPNVEVRVGRRLGWLVTQTWALAWVGGSQSVCRAMAWLTRRTRTNTHTHKHARMHTQESVRESIAYHMAYAHQCVTEASVRFLEAFRRYNYTTPKSYLELIALYKQLLEVRGRHSEGFLVLRGMGECGGIARCAQQVC